MKVCTCANPVKVCICANPLKVCGQVKQWQHHASVDSTPILVHCRDGAFCSGLYVALALIAARMDEENLVSVYRICRGLRKQCFNAISNVVSVWRSLCA